MWRLYAVPSRVRCTVMTAAAVARHGGGLSARRVAAFASPRVCSKDRGIGDLDDKGRVRSCCSQPRM